MKPNKAVCLAFTSVFFMLIAGCSAGDAIQSASPSSFGISASAAIVTQKPSQTAQAVPIPSAIVSQASASPPASPAAKTEIADGFYYTKLDGALKKRITGMSFPKDEENAQISYDELRYIRLSFYDFNGRAHTDGELIVNAKLAKEVTQIFYELFQAKYPFTSIRLVDDFGEPGDDNLSMAANNTSAFNYRYVTGTKTLSLHSFGEAIDINPLLNPYITDGRVSPANGAKYADRSLGLPGMISRSDLCYKLFTQNGWKWGGDSAQDKDYQHFSKKTAS